MQIGKIQFADDLIFKIEYGLNINRNKIELIIRAWIIFISNKISKQNLQFN